MKKNSKVIRKNYEKYDSTLREYYGLFIKNGVVKIDTKRYKKIMGGLYGEKMNDRNIVYYTPSKMNRYDYSYNLFVDELKELKRLWLSEFSKAITIIKTPKEVAEEVRINNMMDGVLDPDEASTYGLIASIKREKPYRFVIKSIYAQFFHQMMSQIDALCLRVCISHGYKEDDFSKKSFDIFIQGKQNQPAKAFKDFENYWIFDKAYLVWNFLKHNSKRSYDELKRKFPEMIYDPNNEYKNGDLALSCLKLDEKFIMFCLDNMYKFFEEVCILGFYEDTKNASWDYANYFIEQVDLEIETVTNPLGLSDYI